MGRFHFFRYQKGRTNMTTINLRGREIPLIFTTWEMKEIQEALGPMEKAIASVSGRNPNNEDLKQFGSSEHLTALATMIRIMGNGGLEEAGESPDLTEKKIMRAIHPSMILDMINACMDVMNDGMASEIPEKKEEGPVDVTLEEMNKKKEKEP